MATGHHQTGAAPRTAVAVGGAEAVAKLAEALDREPCTRYVLCGACVSDPAAYPEDAPVPRLGAVQDLAEVCEKSGADTVLISRDGGWSSPALRQLASELHGRDVELLVAQALTDEGGLPTVRTYPLAGLQLVEVRYPEDRRTASPLGRLGASLGPPLLRALPMALLVVVVIWLASR